MSCKIAFVVEKFVDTTIGGEPAIHSNFIKFLLQKGFVVDVYCEKNEADNFNGNIFSQFTDKQSEYRTNLNKQNYELIISSKFGLKFAFLNADIYSIHSHSDLCSQKTKYGFFYNIFKPKQKRIKNEIKNLNANKEAVFVFCSNQLQKDYATLLDGTFKECHILEPYSNCIMSENYRRVDNRDFTFGISALGFQNKGGYWALVSAFFLKLLGKKFKLKMIYKKNGGFLQNVLVLFLGLKKNVEFLEKQTDMRKFYEKIDCLLMPSLLESFGMVAAEAASYGLPVIVSFKCGITQKIIDLHNGFVFNYNGCKIFNLFKKMKQIMEMEDFDALQKNILNTKFNDENFYNEYLEAIIKNVDKKEF